MKFLSALFVFLLACASVTRAQHLAGHAGRSSSSTSRLISIDAVEGQLPLSFEANQGQSDPQVRYLSHGLGSSLFLTDSEAVLALSRATSAAFKNGTQQEQSEKSDVFRMQLAGASPALRVKGADQLEGKVNYFIGKDAANWHSNIPTFEKVKYTAVYPGIDLLFYGNQRQLEYDFVVAANADPRQIKLHFAEAGKAKLEASGDLEVVARYGKLTFHKPIVYQIENGNREPVDGSFQLLAKNTVTFRLGSYDHDSELIIDPVVAYSTYLGAKVADSADYIAVNSFGNAFIAGSTSSPNFPTTRHAYQTSSFSFLSELNSAGNHLLYSTYFGGPGGLDVSVNALATDSDGNAYLAGSTTWTGFPTTPGAYEPTASSYPAGFVTKFNPTGGLAYSTYLGHESQVNAIAVDSGGDVYVGGSTYALHPPTTSGAYQQTYTNDGGFRPSIAFLMKLNSLGSGLIYSTLLGPNLIDQLCGTNILSVNVDATGSAIVSGIYNGDRSCLFPITAGSFLPGAPSPYNGFVTKFDTTGSSLIYSTHYPANRTVLDPNGNVYGYAESGPDTIGGTHPSPWSWIGALNSAGSALIYGTYIPVTFFDSYPNTKISAIAVDADGHLFAAGETTRTDFPITEDAFQSSYQGVSNSNRVLSTPNAVFAELAADGSKVLYATYLGGRGNAQYGGGDAGLALAVDASNNVYIAGSTASHNFPVTPGALQTANKSPRMTNAFITKFVFNGATTTTISSSATSAPEGKDVTFYAHVRPLADGSIPAGQLATFFVDGHTLDKHPLDGSGMASFTTSSLSVGTHTIQASFDGGPLDYSASASAPLTVMITATP